MNVLITGGTGFIGSRLALRCLELGYDVRVFGMENTDAEVINSRMIKEKGAKVILGSMNDKQKIFDAAEGVDIIFHLAAVQHEMNIPDKVFWSVNVEGTRNILDAALDAKVKRFIHGSTIGVYGSLEGHIDESSPCNPENIYGKTKLEGEMLTLSYNTKLPVVVIRIPETYGPGDRRLLKLFRAIKKRNFFVIGDGQNLHHLLYVDDLVDGFLLAANSDRAPGEIFLLGGPKPVSTQEMVEIVAKVMNTAQPAFRLPLLPFIVAATLMEKSLRPLGIQPPLHRRRMDFFIKSFSLDISKAADLIGFVPNTDFETGAAETADWYIEKDLLSSTQNQIKEGKSKIILDNKLSAIIEPFDTFWEAPEDIERGYGKFETFYRQNYLKFVPKDKKIRSLVISCGAGYFLELMRKEGFTNFFGIDSDSGKIDHAKKRGLNCEAMNAFPYLQQNSDPFDFIFAEQEINHLTKSEILEFLELCHNNLKDGGSLIIHSLNGANPITGSEALAQNFNHFNTFTEYSLKQILMHANFRNTQIFPLNLYVFYKNPANYIGMGINALLNLLFRALFIFYGKNNKIFTKKIAAVCQK
jgi:nucleoside-diphosphate-sugar epimerase/2-polyprenyl-3-methyl-5-hydroxy-6-metoxy-1,4-benzoquinol methylase